MSELQLFVSLLVLLRLFQGLQRITRSYRGMVTKRGENVRRCDACPAADGRSAGTADGTAALGLGLLGSVQHMSHTPDPLSLRSSSCHSSSSGSRCLPNVHRRNPRIIPGLHQQPPETSWIFCLPLQKPAGISSDQAG